MAKTSSNDQNNINIKRQYWGKNNTNLPALNLTKIQLDSYEWFINEGISQILSEIFPIEDYTGKNYTLSLKKFFFGYPSIGSEKAIEKGLTYDIPLKIEVELLNKQTSKKITQEVFIGDIPKMTEVGTFIINGIERCVVNQLVRSPGVYFTGTVDPVTGKTLYSAEIRPLRGSWLEFNVGRNNLITVKIDRRRKFSVTTFLKALGYGSAEELKKLFINIDTGHDKFIETTLAKDTAKSTIEAVLEIYHKMRPGEPSVLDNAKQFLNNLFFNSRRYDMGKVGRYKLNKKLNLEISIDKEHVTLSKEDIVAAIKYLIRLQNNDEEASVDDIDHLANRRVRRVGELVGLGAFRVGLLRLEKTVKEKMSLTPTDLPSTPSILINARPVTASVNEFFRSSQLSAILDQTNPLSEIDNLRRLSVMGTGGVNRERASFSIRDINTSQYGRICPVRSPEGPNIGLVTYMSLYARINEFGFLETPYRKIIHDKDKAKISDEIVYLTADEEERYNITHAEINIDRYGYIQDKRVPVRYKGDYLETSTEKVQLIDIIARQVVGTSASLIPFLSHDEPNRALMGTHMQCQAVPLIKPNSPIVGTGMEPEIVQAMHRTIKAKHLGIVDYVDAAKIIIKIDEKIKGEIDNNNSKIKIEGNKEIYPMEKFRRSAQSTCYSQKPLVKKGDRVKKGQVIIDGPACQDGELALGQNLLIAYASFDGLGYEDAIVISERLVREDVLTSIHIEEYECAVVDTKLGPEETTRDIPNVGETDLAKLDEKGIIVVGSRVAPNDILVGKIAPKGETELSAEERLLRAIFGEKAREVRDTSLRIPHGEKGVVIDVQILNKEEGDELEPGTNKLIIVKIAQIRKVVVGDKLAGRHGNKGVISKIVPQADMPYLGDGTPVDIIISPLSVLARMNLGQLLEAHLGLAAKKLGYKVAIPVFEEVKEEIITAELKKANLPLNGKDILYDGRTGKPIERSIVVGIEYIMKLIHMVEDKTHARSTGPYSLVTQQPLGGKAQMGGQRLGEMEVWALEAHRAAHTLQEMLTIKSDDVIGRAKTFEAIVKGTDIPQSTVPESFKVLAKELNSLGLNMIPLEAKLAKTDVAEEGHIEKLAQEIAKESGEELKEENPLPEKKIEQKTPVIN